MLRNLSFFSKLFDTLVLRVLTKNNKPTREDTILIISAPKIICENFAKYQGFNPVLVLVIIIKVVHFTEVF